MSEHSKKLGCPDCSKSDPGFINGIFSRKACDRCNVEVNRHEAEQESIRYGGHPPSSLPWPETKLYRVEGMTFGVPTKARYGGVEIRLNWEEEARARSVEVDVAPNATTDLHDVFSMKGLAEYINPPRSALHEHGALCAVVGGVSLPAHYITDVSPTYDAGSEFRVKIVLPNVRRGMSWQGDDGMACHTGRVPHELVKRFTGRSSLAFRLPPGWDAYRVEVDELSLDLGDDVTTIEACCSLRERKPRAADTMSDVAAATAGIKGAEMPSNAMGEVLGQMITGKRRGTLKVHGGGSSLRFEILGNVPKISGSELLYTFRVTDRADQRYLDSLISAPDATLSGLNLPKGGHVTTGRVRFYRGSHTYDVVVPVSFGLTLKP